VSAKVRLVDGPSESEDVIRALFDAGACCVAVHTRHVGDAIPAVAARPEALAELARRLGPSRPLLANGDLYDWDDIGSVAQSTVGVLLGRPALLDPSIFRGRGRRVPRAEVLKAYVRLASAYDAHVNNAKYVVMEMLSRRRHPPAAHALLKRDPPPADVDVGAVGACKSMRALADLFGAAADHDRWAAQRARGRGAEAVAEAVALATGEGGGGGGGGGGDGWATGTAAAAAAAGEEAALGDGRTYSDAYFAAELADGGAKRPRLAADETT